MGRADKILPLGCQIMRLAQQVGKREPQIEGRLSEMNDLVIEQHQPSGVDQDVLGTVVAVHEAVAMPPSVRNQTVQKRRSAADLACGVGVIRFQPERLEKGLVLKNRQELGFSCRAAAVDAAKQRRELSDMFLFEVAI